MYNIQQHTKSGYVFPRLKLQKKNKTNWHLLKRYRNKRNQTMFLKRTTEKKNNKKHLLEMVHPLFWVNTAKSKL